MLIRVKIGKVELEYTEPTAETKYPKCINEGLVEKIDGVKTQHDALLKTITTMVDKAVEAHSAMGCEG